MQKFKICNALARVHKKFTKIFQMPLDKICKKKEFPADTAYQP